MEPKGILKTKGNISAEQLKEVAEIWKKSEGKTVLLSGDWEYVQINKRKRAGKRFSKS